MQEPHVLETRLDRLWKTMVDTRERAQASTDFSDQLAAGRAFAEWNREFLRTDGEPAQVIPMRREAGR